jgi:hypothetical protein
MPSVLGRHCRSDSGCRRAGVRRHHGDVRGERGLLAAVGKVVDRLGARSLMASGSWSMPWRWSASPAPGAGELPRLLGVMGIASALALSTPSSIAIVQVAGPRARQAIAMLTIIGGLPRRCSGR